MHVLCACGVLWRQEARREGSRYYTYFITSDVDRWAHGIGHIAVAVANMSDADSLRNELFDSCLRPNNERYFPAVSSPRASTVEPVCKIDMYQYSDGAPLSKNRDLIYI